MRLPKLFEVYKIDAAKPNAKFKVIGVEILRLFLNNGIRPTILKPH